MTDVDTLARTMWGEARSLGAEGMTNIALVIANRAAKPGWWGHDVESVCLAREQFSCWNVGDPNRQKCLDVTVADPAFNLALTIAESVLAAQIEDVTVGATNYCTIAKPSWANEWPPKWAANMVETFRDAAHVFYRATQI